MNNDKNEEDTQIPKRRALITSWVSTPGNLRTLEDEVIEAIEQAESSVHVHVYKLRSKKIKNALLDAHHKGKTVKVLLDYRETTFKKKQNKIANEMIEMNMQVKLEPEARKAHVKVIIIDKKKVITGSYNLISRKKNDNRLDNLIAIEDPQVALDFLSVFDRHFPVKPAKKIRYRSKK